MNSTFADYYEPVVLSATDYYPFGMEMPSRTMASNGYRYGFNGKEKDTEGEWGTQTHYDYGFRIYEPGIGKFLSVDPLMKEYPFYTPYQFAGNKPIWARDIDGLEEKYTTTFFRAVFGSPKAYQNPRTALDYMTNTRLQFQRKVPVYLIFAIYKASGGDDLYKEHSSWDELGSEVDTGVKIPPNIVNINRTPSSAFHNERVSILQKQFHFSSGVSGSEAGLVNLLVGGFLRGTTPENIVFPKNGFGSEFLRNSTQVDQILESFVKHGTMKGKAGTPKVSSSISNLIDGDGFKLEDFVGSVDYKISISGNNLTVIMTNVTSITSGTLGKEIDGTGKYLWPKSDVKDLNRIDKSLTNFSQTFSLDFKISEVKKKYK